MSMPSWARPAARGFIHRVLYWAVGLAGFLSRLQRGREDAPRSAVRSVLVVRLDLLGDLLFTVPLLRGVRAAYPDARLTLVTLPYTVELARSYGIADEVLPLDSNRVRTPRGLVDPRTWQHYIDTIRAIRDLKPDVGISVAGRTASLVVFLSGAHQRVGYGSEAYPYALSHALTGGRYSDRKHEVEYVRRLAHSVGATQIPRHLEAVVDDTDAESVREKLSAVGVAPTDRLVVLHAGSINGNAKRWPPVRWGAFATELHAQTGVRIVLAGSTSDASIARAVEEACPGPLASLVGQTSLGELAALIARADLVASGDSGPLHLAVALQRPVVAVYGPTDPAVHGPYMPTATARVHRADLPCSPCYSMAGMADCPLGDPVCMRLVGVDQMVRSAVELLR